MRAEASAEPAPFVAGPLLRHNKTIFAYGNYDQYYRHRHDRCAEVDARIEALLKTYGSSFFTGKRVLDMGCNSGFVTLLAAALGARHAEGVDIDLLLISKALKQLRHLKHMGSTTLPELAALVETDEAAPAASSTSRFPVSCVQARGIIPYHAKPLASGALQAIRSLPGTLPDDGASASAFGGRMEEPSSEGFPFPHNVEFRTENILVSEVEERRGQPYDIILCLKLTKWVHLHWGDDGLQLLLHKCHRLLRPGGLLVLEAQEWSSYLPKKHLTPHTRQNRSLLQFRPQDLGTYLVREVGFERYASLDTLRLKRPLLLFRRVKVLPGRTTFGHCGYQSIAQQVSAVAAAAASTAASSSMPGTAVRPPGTCSLIAQTASVAAAMSSLLQHQQPSAAAQPFAGTSAAMSSERMSPPRRSPTMAAFLPPMAISTSETSMALPPPGSQIGSQPFHNGAGFEIPPPPPPAQVPAPPEDGSEGPESKRQRTEM